MEIKVEKITIEFENNELWSMAIDLRRSFYLTIKEHWIHHQDKWKESEKFRLKLLESFFNILDRRGMYDEIFIEANSIFEKYNNTKNGTKK